MKLRDKIEHELKCSVSNCSRKVSVYLTGEFTGQLNYYCATHARIKIESQEVVRNLQKDIPGTLQNLLS